MGAELDVGLTLVHVSARFEEGAECDGEQAVGHRGLAHLNLRGAPLLECALDCSRAHRVSLSTSSARRLSQSGHEVE